MDLGRMNSDDKLVLCKRYFYGMHIINIIILKYK